MTPRTPLPRSTPEAQNVASAAISEFLRVADRDLHDLHSLMILSHGSVIAEGWWAPFARDLPHKMFSVSKSFTAMGVGFAIDEGALTLDDLVVDLLPNDLPPVVSANLAAMTVRHLLTMTTGHGEDTMATLTSTEHNWSRAILSAPVALAPGSTFVYNSGATYLLSAILQSLTGERLLDYLTPRLLDPLGIVGAAWEACPRGIDTGGWGLNITTEDMALFGQLLLQRGAWNGASIMPSGWVDEATAFQVPNELEGEDADHTLGYGYQFWRSQHGAYRADGAFGQMIIVLPEAQSVVVMTSGLPDTQPARDAVWEHLLPALSGDVPLPADAAAPAALRGQLARLEVRHPAAVPAPGLADRVAGIRFDFDDNDAGLVSVRLERGSLTVATRWEGVVDDHPIAFGSGTWVAGRAPSVDVMTNGEQTDMAASGAWVAPDTFAVTMQFTREPFAVTFSLRFSANVVELTMTQNVSFLETLIARETARRPANP
ncbi:MAG: serine hydrolase [Burkholderiaceae bacterium]|nr:serine hydrolase [Microbacteriaceae bacterium]